MPRPSTVAIMAWPMPLAMSFGSLEPDSVMLWNVMIMPTTVPIRPSSGPAATHEAQERLEALELRHLAQHGLGDAQLRDLGVLLDLALVALEGEQHAAERVVRRRAGRGS